MGEVDHARAEAVETEETAPEATDDPVNPNADYGRAPSPPSDDPRGAASVAHTFS